MASNDLKLIIEKLQEKFLEERIIFWYDDEGDFTEYIEEIENALSSHDVKIHILNKNEQFRTKYLLEHQEPEQKYLVYAAFGKPQDKENCLEDTIQYSTRFSADQLEMLMNDLRITKPELRQTIIDNYGLFFKSRERKDKFIELNQHTVEWGEAIICLGMMMILTKTKSKSFEDILLDVLNAGADENALIKEIGKYGLEKRFWSFCKDEYGYDAESPSLENLILSLFATYAASNITEGFPDPWKRYRAHRSNNVSVLLGKMMNSKTYVERFSELSSFASRILRVEQILKDRDVGDYIECNAFDDIDVLISNWMLRNLLDKNIHVRIGNSNIQDICSDRKRKFFGEKHEHQYDMFTAACKIISSEEYVPASSFIHTSEKYVTEDYKIDRAYRDFYDAWSQIPDKDEFEDLKGLVENTYANEYLFKQIPAWNNSLDIDEAMRGSKAQRRFFNTHIKGTEKTAVIISDALRYEVGRELFERLEKDPKYDVKLDYMLCSLPAYTQLGMASLLPNKELEIQKDSSVLSDGLPTNSTEKREAILRKAIPNSRCVQSSRIRHREASREIFNGMEVVYIYHDQIDARGKDAMADEVFRACKEAIDELGTIVKKLRSGNVYRILITADHGFLFKWDGITESDKIDLDRLESNTIKDRRFIISNNRIESEGVMNVRLGEVLGTDDQRNLSWPKGSNVFKTAGGQNFVHGGASPQEMIIPLITIKVGRDKAETRPVEITLITTTRKVINLNPSFEFLQKEPVSDEIKPAEYKAFFVAEDPSENISDMVHIFADRTDSDPQKRSIRVRFNIKDRKFTKDRKYWLVVTDENGHEAFREPFIMDIAFSSGISFD